MNSHIRSRPALHALCLTVATLGLCTQAGAQAKGALTEAVAPGTATPKVTPPAASPGADAKDVVVDSAAPARAAATPDGRLVPTPTAPAAAAPASPAPTPAVAAVPAIFTTPLHDASTAAALGDFGLALLQQQSLATGRASVNAVYSPLSAATALGIVHAGAAGETARELAALLGAGSGGDRMFSARLPSVISRLGPTGAAGDVTPFVMANRVWVQQAVASSLQRPFLAMAQERFGADAVGLAFDDPSAAVRNVNQWTAQQTRNRIRQLLPAGSLTPTTRLVVTNAMHFKAAWARPFDPKATVPKAFQVSATESKRVPTMVDERTVRQGVVDNISVIELPFAGDTHALLIGMPPKGHSLDALEKDLAGLDMASWSSQLKDSTCKLELPRFSIEGQATSLKTALRAMGVRTVFTPQAELQPLLGTAAAGVSADDVFHAATIVIDEQGGEATAATAATASLKSFAPQPPTCPVDRAFVFAVVHKPTGIPLFVGKVADPSNGR